jgi:hypothetical protein
MNGYFNDDSTQPLPPSERGPLLLVIDIQANRRIWVSHLLAYANYHTYSVSSPRESFIWYMQHQTIVHGLLVGDIPQQEHFIAQRLLQRMISFQRTDIPTFSLSAYLPDEARIGSIPFTPRAQGGIALLEALWLQVARQGK